MDVPPPVRRPKLPLSRAARVAIVGLLVGLFLAWTVGSARIEEWCGVCRSLRRSTAIGLFWDDDHRLALAVGGDEFPSPAYTDTFQAWGHAHTWQVQRGHLRRFVPELLLFRTTWCPRAPHPFHSETSLAFNAFPELRRSMAAKIAEGKWTVSDLEDALLWCDQTSCPFDWNDLPSDVADRRRHSHARLQPLIAEARRAGEGR